MRQTAWALALLGLLAMAGLMRPLLPIDETRYAAVAWEMWARSDFLVPHLNGEPYAHKPPLLFWIVQAGWALFGVNEWWPRLVSPLFAGGTMALAARLARELWPARPDAARIAPLVLVSSLLFSYFASALMFDAMLGFFVTLGFLGLARAWREQAVASGFVLLALGLGGALLSKGPVALVHLLPAALLAPLWMREARPRWGRWYAGVGLAVLGGAALVLAWAIPAAIAGGEDYRAAIFWGQTAGRMVGSFAHKAAWWFYLASLPLMFMPWILWPRWWRGLGPALATGDSGVRLVVLGFLASLLLFSLVSGKQWQYLLPEFPLFALLVARTVSDGRAGRWSMAWPALIAGGAGRGGATGRSAPRAAPGRLGRCLGAALGRSTRDRLRHRGCCRRGGQRRTRGAPLGVRRSGGILQPARGLRHCDARALRHVGRGQHGCAVPARGAPGGGGRRLPR